MHHRVRTFVPPPFRVRVQISRSRTYWGFSLAAPGSCLSTLHVRIRTYTYIHAGKSHAHTVVWECCKDDQQSQWEMLKFDPQLPLNPSGDRHQIWRAWLRHGYISPRKNWAQSVKGFLLPIHAKYTPSHVGYATLYACLLLFWFFQSPTAETPAWILTLKTSNDAVLRKEVRFEGYNNEISYLAEY